MIFFKLMVNLRNVFTLINNVCMLLLERHDEFSLYGYATVLRLRYSLILT